eukprot:768657-Hanusia_phi.AAC.10
MSLKIYLDVDAIVPKRATSGSACYDLRELIDTGVHVQFPNDYMLQILSRSGDRIAQMALIKIATPVIEIVKILGESDRGNSGFGSSGK